MKYSDRIKSKTVHSIQTGNLTVSAAVEKLGASRGTIYKWLKTEGSDDTDSSPTDDLTDETHRIRTSRTPAAGTARFIHSLISNRDLDNDQRVRMISAYLGE